MRLRDMSAEAIERWYETIAEMDLNELITAFIFSKDPAIIRALHAEMISACIAWEEQLLHEQQSSTVH
jgi:hypothetical protein